MNFKFIDNVVQNISLNLEILRVDSNLYSTLLYQHKGTFLVKDTSFGNDTDCSAQFNSFLNLAKSENVSLALTPEYSCPWESIDLVLSNEERWPNEGKLWAICCESITPDEIKEFLEKFETDNIIVIADTPALSNGNGVLLDPLCYIFRVEVGGVNKLLVIIQFKTQHMGVWENNVEQEKYIWGNDIFVLRNSVDSIYLFTMICSEAIEFKIDDSFKQQLDNRWNHNPYIILNPQMNPKPSHDGFKNFRNSILKYDLKDIISINWGSGTRCSEVSGSFIPFSKSSVIVKSDQVDYANEDNFVNNHIKGLYYVLRKPNIQINYLNPKIDVFLIRNQKPSAAGVNEALVKRAGPAAWKCFKWNGDICQFDEKESVEDGFIEFLKSLNFTNTVCNNEDISIIDKERLVNISSGLVKAKKQDRRWYNIDKLESFLQQSDESIKRFTYVHDESGREHRSKYVEIMDTLNSQILVTGTFFPKILSSFVDNCTEVMFIDSDSYKYNLATSDGSRKATVAYVGRTEKAYAMRTLKRIQNIFEPNDQSKKMVVVWYKIGSNDFVPVVDLNQPTISDDTSKDPNSIF